TRSHPDIETLANYIDGQLAASDADATKRHLDSCPVCRLEIKRIERFEAIESDKSLREEANWPAAQVRLERAFRDNVLPEVVARQSIDARPFWSRWQVRWLVPVAAAAALLVVFQIDRSRPPGTPSDDLGPMRGPTTEELSIALEAPSGNIERLPEQFTWRSTRKNDYYKIAIFTSDLTKIYEESELPESRWAASDSLRSLLKVETIYIWTVTGQKGVEREVVSPNGWFKITPGRRGAKANTD
ncbi:MAG: zf-HC2 domain-containing protein, partial [Candidatus Krumholzibacteria bacterium]|nr:zf-HC2 domain-containing protein [Candidatus Krumholzibacteria bacterium]